MSKCPFCQAVLPARMDDGIVVCAYCGKEVTIEHTVFLRRPQVRAPAKGAGAAQPTMPMQSRAIVAWIAMPMVLSGVIAGAVAFTKAGSTGLGGAQGSGALAQQTMVSLDRDFWIYDSDGDGTEDLVSSYTEYDSQAGETIVRIGAFSGQSQKRLWATDPFEESPALHLHGDRLFAADSTLGLVMLDVKTGAAIAKLTTSDKVNGFCDQPSGEATWISLSDETGFLMNHVDGQVTEENQRPEYCSERQHHDCPSEPVAKSCEEWDPTTTIIKAPFVFVEQRAKCLKLNPNKSGAWMHAGKCRRKKIDGMKGRVLLGKDDSFLVLGEKSPGTGFPMIAGLQDQTLLWQRLVDRGPVENLEKPTWTGSEYLGEFGPGQFVLAYKDKLGFKLISIDLKTGEDRWLQPISGSEKFDIARFHATASRIYVLFSGAHLRIFDASTGASLGSFGN